MWYHNLLEYQWRYIARTMDKLNLSYEWKTGDYTSIKLKEEHWKEHFPYYYESMKDHKMNEQEFTKLIQKLVESELTEDQLGRLQHLVNNWSMYKN